MRCRFRSLLIFCYTLVIVWNSSKYIYGTVLKMSFLSILVIVFLFQKRQSSGMDDETKDFKFSSHKITAQDTLQFTFPHAQGTNSPTGQGVTDTEVKALTAITKPRSSLLGGGPKPEEPKPRSPSPVKRDSDRDPPRHSEATPLTGFGSNDTETAAMLELAKPRSSLLGGGTPAPKSAKTSDRSPSPVQRDRSPSGKGNKLTSSKGRSKEPSPGSRMKSGGGVEDTTDDVHDEYFDQPEPVEQHHSPEKTALEAGSSKIDDEPAVAAASETSSISARLSLFESIAGDSPVVVRRPLTKRPERMTNGGSGSWIKPVTVNENNEVGITFFCFLMVLSGRYLSFCLHVRLTSWFETRFS